MHEAKEPAKDEEELKIDAGVSGCVIPGVWERLCKANAPSLARFLATEILPSHEP